MNINTAIILAGGRASRMGFDKQEIKIQGKYIGTYQADILSEIFDEIIIVTKRPDLYSDRPYKTLEDIYPGQGPLSGLHAGLASSSSDGAFVLACDMPYIDLSYISYIKSLAQDTGVSGVYQGYIEPMYSIYPRFITPDLEDILSQGLDSRPRILIEKHKFTLVKEDTIMELTGGFNIFANLNTPEDLEKFQKSIEKT